MPAELPPDFPERLRQLVADDYADEDLSAIVDNQLGLLALADALDEARRVCTEHPGVFPELELRLNRLKGFA